MQSVGYLNREFSRTNLLGSYSFFPKAAWFRFLNHNEMIMMMIMIKRVRITKANTFWTFQESTHHFFRRLWKCFSIGVPKRRRLRFIQFVVSILRWFEELSSCPSPFCWSAGDTRGKVFMLMSYPPNRTYRICAIERLSKSWGNPFLWAFSEPDLLRFYTKNQADVHLNTPSLPRRRSWGFVTRSCAWRTPKIVCVGSYNTPRHSRDT